MSTAEAVDTSTEVRPLAGRTLVVTRARAQAAELAGALEALGARVLRFPTIRLVPPDDPERLRRAVREAADYDWVVFTSANGVESFARAASETDVDMADSLGTVRVCCIGPATARALTATGAPVDLEPASYVAEAVLDALSAEGPLAGRRILIPTAADARPVLPDGLRELGAEVDVVVAYRTVPADEAPAGILAELRAGVDLVTFTSPSTVRAYHRLVGGRGATPAAAVIGPVTAAAARELGYAVEVEADEFTTEGLVESVVEHFEGGPS